MPAIKNEQEQASDRRAISKRRKESKAPLQRKCGYKERRWGDDFNDVRLACERKIAEWERLGIIAPRADVRNNDWIFA